MEPIEILWEDEQVLAVMKPAGIASQGQEGRDLVSLLKAQTGGAVYPVHRLDRDTSGVLILARTQEAASSLCRSVAEGKWRKTYLAVTCRRLPEDAGGMEDLLYHDPVKNKSFPVRRERRGVRRARLEYRLIGEKNGRFLYEVHPFTGRTHQIRVQFAARGYPLLGDSKYGGPPAPHAALLSQRIRFPHPGNGAEMEVCAPKEKFFWEFYP